LSNIDLTWIGLELNPALRYKARRLSWAMAHPFFTVDPVGTQLLWQSYN